MKIIWLLDFDGVVNVIGKPTPYYSEWTSFSHEVEGVQYPITTANAVIDFIDAFPGEVIWCTTWQQYANDVGKRLGLRPMRWVNAKKCGRDSSVWWKQHAVEVALGLGHRVVWTDDDIDGWNMPISDNLAAIKPKEYEGLLPKHLKVIREFSE